MKIQGNKATRLACLLLGMLAVGAGCEKGPAEKAGAKIDEGVQKAKDAIDPAGPAEKAGRAVDKALSK